MIKRHYETLQETVYHERLENGLDVYLIPKNDFHKTYVTFTAKYGSIDAKFKLANEPEFHQVPDGIAHFLEHKVFEMPDGVDAFTLFSNYGANANAYTSYTRTTYLFSTTSDLSACTQILLDFVQTPHFTPSNVEKEKGIIEQEINMYEDYPDWRLQNGLMRNLYIHHPIAVDIAGSVKSIYQIDADLLKRCYDTFYHPANMQFVAVGSFDPYALLEEIKTNQDTKHYPPQEPILRDYGNEPSGVKIAYEEEVMSCTLPKVAIGLKLPKVDGLHQLNYELLMSIFVQLAFGDSSDFYEYMMENELINDTFEAYAIHEDGADALIISGDTSNKDTFIHEVKQHLFSLKESGISEEAFLRAKNGLIGKYIQAFNSVESISSLFSRFESRDMDVFTIPNVIETLTTASLNLVLKTFDEANISVYVILPNETEN